MDAGEVAIAEAVRQQIADATDLACPEFALERSDAEWDLELEEAAGLRIDVVASASEKKLELLSRGLVKLTAPIDIAVRRKFSQEHLDDQGLVRQELKDALKLLVQQIWMLFMPQTLDAFTAGAWQETKIVVCPDRKALREWRQFTGIVRVTFTTELEVV